MPALSSKTKVEKTPEQQSGLEYFFNLYLRNAKSVFTKGFIDSKVYGFPAIWLAHLITLPLTITVGAFFKTLFDYMSRDFSTKPNEIEAVLYDLDMEKQGGVSDEKELKETTSFNLPYFEQILMEASPKSESSKTLKAEILKVKRGELEFPFLEKSNSSESSKSPSQVKASLFYDFLTDPKNKGKRTFNNLVTARQDIMFSKITKK